jgi:hypothetical protein
MNTPTDPIVWLKIAGAASTAIGSFLLAWRVKSILQWVIYCLIAHEQSISQLRKNVSNLPQDRDIVEGVTKHLLDVESKLGLFLLVTGFLCLGVGMLCQATTYFLESQ